MEKAQVRAARALLGWSQEDLATRAGVSVATIRRQEPGHGQFLAGEEVLRKIADALQGAGVVLIPADSDAVDGGCGVRLASHDGTARLLALNIKIAEAKVSLQSASRMAQDTDVRSAIDNAIDNADAAIELVARTIEQNGGR